MINNIIVEGADQQGKTTVCRELAKILNWPIKHFGLPIPEDFDFHSHYLLPKNTISDRSFISELVYSTFRPGHHRVKELSLLQDKMIAANYLVIICDRGDDFIYDDREEAFSEAEIDIARLVYTEISKSIRVARIYVNPVRDMEYIKKFIPSVVIL